MTTSARSVLELAIALGGVAAAGGLGYAAGLRAPVPAPTMPPAPTPMPAPAPAPAGGTLTLAQLRALATAVGFADPVTAAAVAMAESGGNPAAVGDCAGGRGSFGLWQIHQPDHTEYAPASLMDATYNAHAALAISHGGTDWHLWSAFTNGRYRQYMTGA